MSNILTNIHLNNPVSVLFLIAALGIALGKFNIKGITLGSSGVLFVGLLFGHLGFKLPTGIQDLGIILFVYMVGLQAGPRFFSTFKRHGFVFAQLAIILVVAAGAATLATSVFFNIPTDLATGMFSGAMTSTPGLAAATEAAGNTTPSVGYGLAYPVGIVAIILFVQVVPRLRALTGADDHVSRSTGGSSAQETPVRAVFRIENPAVIGRSIKDLNLHTISNANLTRIQHGEVIGPARADTVLEPGDYVSVAGPPAEVKKFRLLLGPEVEQPQIWQSKDVVRRDIFISAKGFSGKSLAQLQVQERYGIVISRIERDGWYFSPTGAFVLETGDAVRIVGTEDDCNHFRQDAGQDVKRVHETNILSFLTGIILGSLLGFTPISLPGGITFRLGLAGGPLLVALLFSHFGRIGPINIRVPYGAKYILRELGLIFFLAGAGVSAGQDIARIIAGHGVSLFAGSLVITLVPLLFGYWLCTYVYRFDTLSMLGAMAGGMTSTPALGAVTSMTDSENPTLAYTSIYPVALIATTVAAQLLILLM